MPIALRRVLFLAAVALVVFAGAYRISDSSTDVRAAGVGGPVILGGDDLTDHGSVDGGGDAVAGWLYIQRAIENIGPNVTRPGNDGSIAALGSAAGSVATSSDAGAAIDLAGSKTGRAVTHYEGPTEIDTFFTDLASATAKPAIIHLAGTGAPNDFDSTEETAITAHAAEIASFVSSGGGLLSHGTYYDWLTALLPGATTVLSGDDGDDLYFTPDGLAALPGLTIGNINTDPWHNHFEGDLGGLKVLVRSSRVLDSSDNDAAVIIGGAKVTFETPTQQATPTQEATPTTHVRLKTYTPTRTPTAAPTSTPTPEPATSTATVSATVEPTGGRAGVITGPNTGGGSAGGSSRWTLLFGAAMLAVAGAFATAMSRKVRR
jgi:hypothetical protein